jgi:hypothetical protein
MPQHGATGHEQVRGWSAHRWMEVGLRLLVPAAAGCVVVVLSIVAASRGASSGDLFSVSLGAAVVFGGLSTVARGIGISQGKRERRAGYTTLAKAFREVDQLDPVMWTVVRRAGEPFLTPAELRARRLLLGHGFALDAMENAAVANRGLVES